MRNRFLLGFLLFFVGLAQAAPVISVSVDPNRSRNGEPVLLKIKVQNDSNESVRPPNVPLLADWDVVNSFRAEYPTSVIVNGRITYRYRGEFSYVLKPLRS